MTEKNRICLKNVRLSFPSVFNKEVFEGKEGKFAATFLISKKDVKLKKELDERIAKVIAEAKVRIASDKICLKDGDDSTLEGYEGHYSLKASNKKRPLVLDKDKSVLTEEDDKIYAGCYVNAVIDFWVQNNAFGKKVNANLYAIQFAKDGERFGNSGPSSDELVDDFDDLSEEL